MLTAAVYEPWIDLRATLCVLDPRQLLDEKAVTNDNFRDQLAAADVIISNKADRSTEESQRAFAAWWQAYAGDRRFVSATRGNIDPALLDLPRRNLAPLPASAEHAHGHEQKQGLAALGLPAHQRWRRSLNSGQGYHACGWILTLKPFSTPLPCSNGRAWRRSGASKALCALRRGWYGSIVNSLICILRRRTSPHPTAASS